MPDPGFCSGVRSGVTRASRAPCCRRCAAFEVLADQAGPAAHDGRTWVCEQMLPLPQDAALAQAMRATLVHSDAPAGALHTAGAQVPAVFLSGGSFAG